MMKRILILSILGISFLLTPQIVEAQTVRQGYEELQKLENDANKNKAAQAKTQEEIKQIKIEINNIAVEMVKIEQETKNLKEEIVELNEKIKIKEQETKDLFTYYQLSNGESAYLEYAFGAEDMADFIYRVAIVEQLSQYNKELVGKMNQLIKENIEKGEELEEKEKDLENKKQDYARRSALLIDEMRNLNESFTEIEDDIKAQKDLLAVAIAKGCKMDDDMNNCLGGLIPNSSIKRPTRSGRISSNYGPRNLSVASGPFHYGIDIAGLPVGTPLYSPASGIVTSTGRGSCQGNNVWITFIYGGQYYTVTYAHMQSINVSIGQKVTSDSIIGTLGNTGTCTTGAHLHFETALGARYITSGAYGVPKSASYTLYSDHMKRVFNPRNIFNFPALGGSFSSR